jgi:hypothetical protein
MRVWVSVIMSCLIWTLNDPASQVPRPLGHLFNTGNLRCGYQGLGCVLSRSATRSLDRADRWPLEGAQEDWCGPHSGLVVSPLQPGAVGPYLIRGTWLLSRLSLKRTESYLDLLGRNWQPVVPGVEDPDKHNRPLMKMKRNDKGLAFKSHVP